MIYPIVIYGDPILKKVAIDIDKNYPELNVLIDDMFATMDRASGIGIAAPQIGKSIRLFVVDARPLQEDYPTEALSEFKKVFINPQIIDEQGEEWKFEEGCLSIPHIRDMVSRKPTVNISYLDENFVQHTDEFDGIRARIIQHEYDHIEGVLFIDKLSPLKKSLLRSKLNAMKLGKVEAKYPMLVLGKRV
jgi:peptide deformylase